MFLEVLIIYLIYSRIKGGKFFSFRNLSFSYIFILVIAAIVQLLPIVTSGFIELNLDYKYLHIIGYILILLWLLLNRELEGFKLVFLGLGLNFIAIVFNHGKMPVSLSALEGAGLYRKAELIKTGRVYTHSIMKEDFIFKFLGDIIALGRPYIFKKVISIGDIVLALGLLRFLIKNTEIKRG